MGPCRRLFLTGPIRRKSVRASNWRRCRRGSAENMLKEALRISMIRWASTEWKMPVTQEKRFRSTYTHHLSTCAKHLMSEPAMSVRVGLPSVTSLVELRQAVNLSPVKMHDRRQRHASSCFAKCIYEFAAAAAC
eukprot:scpid62608/ scgid2737/ 